MFLRYVIAVVVLAAVTRYGDAASAQPHVKPEKADVSIAVGGKSLMIYLPLTVAERLGYFKEAGLNVEIQEVNSGTKSLQALIGGSVDATAGSFDHTIQVQAKGQNITSIVLMGRYPGIVLGVVKSKAANYHGPQDFKGMKIGVTAPGSQTNFLVNYVMAKAALKPEDASFIGVGGAASALAAVRKGEIDALSHADPAITQLELSDEIRPIFDTRTTEGTRAVFGGEYPSSVLYVRPEFAAKYPLTTQAMVMAIVRALKWITQATPAEIVDVMPEQNSMGNKALYTNIIYKSKPMFPPDGRMSRAGVENAHRVLSAFDPWVAQAKIDLDATWTDRFVKNALAEQ